MRSFLLCFLISQQCAGFLIPEISCHSSRLYAVKASQQRLEPIVSYPENVKNKINQIVSQDELESVRIRHIQVDTQDMANECRGLLADGKIDFAALASSLSICPISKDKSGELGWHSRRNLTLSEADFSLVSLDLVNAAYFMNIGDMTVVSSTSVDPLTNQLKTNWHVLQLMDVVMKLSPTVKKRRKDRYMSLERNTDPDATGSTGTARLAAKTYAIDTMGCQMNVADSERMEGQLADLGYERVEESDKANLVILNTCAIRDSAEVKVYSYLGPHALRKRKGEDVSIIVAGCVAQQEGKDLLRRFPELDIVMGPQYTNRLADLLEAAVIEGNQIVATDPAYQMEDNLPAIRKSSVTAFVNVIYGCNERCTYCVVPNTRGVEQSRTIDAIVAEVQELVAAGYREVTLLGQNIDSWGRTMSPKQRFADLLAAVGEVEGIERVRFLTSHPRYMSKRVISVVGSNPKLMPCFNIPFQSGDDDVLQMMRRGYTRERYLDIVQSIRQELPDAAITTDCIVGFPGETEEQFQRTLDVLEQVKFEQVNAHAYSARPNTPAGLWSNQLSDEVRYDRLHRIKRLSSVHALQRSERFVGRIDEVLVEDVNPKDPTQVFGRNPHSRLIFFNGRIAELKGKIVPVKVTEAKPYYLFGEVAGNPR